MDFLRRRPTTPWFVERSSMFEPVCNQPKRQEFFDRVDPWSHQPRRQVFIGPEDYYDPIFDGKQQQPPKCSRRMMPAEYDERSLPARLPKPKKSKKKLSNNRYNISEEQELFKSDQRVNDDSGKRHVEKVELKEDDSIQKEKVEKEPIDNTMESVLQSTTLREENENGNPEKETTLEGKEDPVLRKIKSINKIKYDVRLLHERVKNISSESKEYEYLYCEEMLMKCLLNLDDILAEGEDTVRKARKELVLEINKALLDLEQNRDSEKDEDKSSEENSDKDQSEEEVDH